MLDESDLAEALDEAMLTFDNEEIEAAFAFVFDHCEEHDLDMIDVVVASTYGSIYFGQFLKGDDSHREFDSLLDDL